MHGHIKFKMSNLLLRAKPAIFRCSAVPFPAFSMTATRQTQTISKGIKELLEVANAEIETIPTAEAIKLHEKGDPNLLFVDIRDPRELERDGKIPGSVRFCTMETFS